MEVFLPALKKKWVNYLLLSNNNKPKKIQRYELHIPNSVPNEIGEDQVILETDHIDFEGVLIGTHLKTTKTCHNGAMLFKTNNDVRLVICIQEIRHPSLVSYKHIIGTNVFEILRHVKVNEVDLNFMFKKLLPETANMPLRGQILKAIQAFFKLESGIYTGKYSKGYMSELHLLGIKVILQMEMTKNGLKLDKTLVFNEPKLNIEDIKPSEVTALIDLEHLTKYINGEFK